MPHYHQLYTADDCAVIFIDHQPQMLFGVSSMNRTHLLNNVRFLARASEEFNVPTVITALHSENFSGDVWPKLVDVFPGQPIVKRTSMNAWDSLEFRKAVEATGRKNLILTGLWTEVCVAWPAVEMLGVGYNIYVVDDACGATSHEAQKAALSRIVQAGGTRLTALAAVLEFQRDWKNKEHFDALMELLRWHGGAYGMGVEYAYRARESSPSTSSAQA